MFYIDPSASVLEDGGRNREWEVGRWAWKLTAVEIC